MTSLSTHEPQFRETLRRIQALQQRSERDTSGLFWIEGIRNLIHAWDTQHSIETLVHAPILLRHSLAEKIVRRLTSQGVPKLSLSPEQFRELSVAPRAAGVGAIVRQRWTKITASDHLRGSGWFVFETVRSPGNLGTILRSLHAAGATGAVFVGPHCDPFDPNVVRASMGSVFHVPLMRVGAEKFTKWLQHHRVQLVGMTPDGRHTWTDFPATQPLAIALGDERAGLSRWLLDRCQVTVRLPMAAQIDSINVAITTGVMAYELMRRQRHR